jgi:hypothetical protein
MEDSNPCVWSRVSKLPDESPMFCRRSYRGPLPLGMKYPLRVTSSERVWTNGGGTILAKRCVSRMAALSVARSSDLLETVKLMFFGKLNTLKGYLQQADIERCASYRALFNLGRGGCEDLLLQHDLTT